MHLEKIKNESFKKEKLPANDREIQGVTQESMEKIKSIINAPEITETLFPIIEKIDQMWSMEKVRNVWSKMPELSKEIMLYIPSPYSILLNTLVHLGLLEYEEKGIRRIDNVEKTKLKLGINIGKIFIPALNELKLLIQPIMKIREEQEKVLETLRARIKQARKERSEDNLMAG